MIFSCELEIIQDVQLFSSLLTLLSESYSRYILSRFQWENTENSCHYLTHEPGLISGNMTIVSLITGSSLEWGTGSHQITKVKPHRAWFSTEKSTKIPVNGVSVYLKHRCGKPRELPLARENLDMGFASRKIIQERRLLCDKS